MLLPKCCFPVVCGLAFPIPVLSQITEIEYTENRTNSSAIVCSLIADANFKAKKLDIPFYCSDNWTVNLDRATFNIVSGILGLNTPEKMPYFLTVSLGSVLSSEAMTAFGSAWYTYHPYVAYIQMAIAAAQFYADMENTLYRTYTVFIPTSGRYIFKYKAKGGFDNPNNKIFISESAQDGIGLKLDWHDSFSGDQLIEIPFNLKRGQYAIMAGLGSGTSHILHTAGEIVGIRLDENEYKEWKETFVAAESRFPLESNLPNENAQSTFFVDFKGFPPVAALGSPGDAFVEFSNLRPAFGGVLGSLDGSPTRLGQHYYSNKFPIQIIEPRIKNISSPFFNGKTATFFIQRLSNISWIDKPSRWLDYKNY